MEYSPILAPVVALVAWTLVMMVWMAIARRSAFAKLGITWSTIPRGSRGVNLDGRAPDQAQWPSHNYNHLMEQPTIFYAIALTVALMNMGDGINYWLAWGYVGLRVIHSIVQSTVNIVAIRFPIFFLASLCLVGLTVHAGHGLHYHNVQPIAAIPEIVELNIGHAIVAHAVIHGMATAVSEMKRLMLQARGGR